MIFPHQIRSALATRLVADNALVGLLAENRPWNDKNGPLDRRHSIVPMSEIERMIPLYVGILQGPAVLQSFASYETFTYMRVYNTLDKTYYDIDRVIAELSRVLHHARLDMPNTSFIQVELEEVGIDSIDDALRQRYREARFRIVVL